MSAENDMSRDSLRAAAAGFLRQGAEALQGVDPEMAADVTELAERAASALDAPATGTDKAAPQEPQA